MQRKIFFFDEAFRMKSETSKSIKHWIMQLYGVILSLVVGRLF